MNHEAENYVCVPCDVTIESHMVQGFAENEKRYRDDLRELRRCGVPSSTRNVEATRWALKYQRAEGKLGDFEFTNSGRGYWVVTGPVPIHVAWKLYYDPIGKLDIRVDGHCGRPAPVAPWVTFYDEKDRQLVKAKETKEEQAAEEKLHDNVNPDWRDMYVIVEEPEEAAVKGIVDLYHIDSELGLYVFVKLLKEEGVFPE